jgi:hypothetical protein
VPSLWRISWFGSAVVAMAACTVDSDDGQMTFGPGTNATSFTTTMTATTADPTSATTDDVTTSGGVDPTSDGDVDDSDSDGGTSAASTAEDSGGVIEQPEDGMYSHCTSVAQCVGLNVCVVVAVDDGFCSTTPCTDAAACVASPGGTALPICAEVMVGMGMSTACALDCSGGKTCPGGMICAALGAAMVCT